MDARLRLPALLAGIALLTGCSPADSTIASVPAGDPAYAFSQLARGRGLADEGYLPGTLADALPNHRLVLGDTGRVSSLSDAVVVGTVTGVVKGNGVIWRDEDDYTIVGYDDPDASTRTVNVTMTSDRVAGGIDPGAATVTFRVLAPSSADPQEFVEGLAGLVRIAVVLHRDPSRVDDPVWRPVLSDSLIGVVGADGSLTLPGFGARARAFAGDIHTAGELIDAARGPGSTEHLTVP